MLAPTPTSSPAETVKLSGVLQAVIYGGDISTKTIGKHYKSGVSPSGELVIKH